MSVSETLKAVFCAFPDALDIVLPVGLSLFTLAAGFGFAFNKRGGK